MTGLDEGVRNAAATVSDRHRLGLEPPTDPARADLERTAERIRAAGEELRRQRWLRELAADRPRPQACGYCRGMPGHAPTCPMQDQPPCPA